MSKNRTPLTDLGAAGIELARLLQTTDRHQEGLRVVESHRTGSYGVANAAADPQRGRVVGQHHPGFRARCFASGSDVNAPWEPPLQPWEGLFADPHQWLPQVPDVASQRWAWRERQHARKAAKLAAERGDAAGAAAAG
jgi:hypothetical protein